MQYKPAAWYCESVTLMRKVGLAVIAVLLATEGTGVQVMCSIALLVGSLLLHLMAAPHLDERLNGVEAGSLVTAVATLAGGAVLVDDAAPLPWKQAVSVVIVLLNAAFIAVAVALLLWDVLHDAQVRDMAAATMLGIKSAASSITQRIGHGKTQFMQRVRSGASRSAGGSSVGTGTVRLNRPPDANHSFNIFRE